MKLPSPNPFVEMLGVECVSITPGEAVLALTLRPELLNSWGVAHGGVTFTLLDVAVSAAGRSLDPEYRIGATLELKTSFLAPASGRLVAKARAWPQGRSMACAEGEVTRDDGTLVAKALGTFKFRGAKVAGGRTEKMEDGGWQEAGGQAARPSSE